MKMKLTEDQMLSILEQSDIEGFDYEFVEQSDWEVEDKIQHCEVVFKYEGKYYAFYPYRHGDYYSGYEIDFFEDDVIEVTKEAFTSYRWVKATSKETSSEPVDCQTNQ